jgi:hypothetical protein
MKSMNGLTILGMLCWLVMFLTATDVWHFAGRPDFSHLSGPPYTDIRAFAFAFYLQFFILLAMLAVTSWTALKAIRSADEAGSRV